MAQRNEGESGEDRLIDRFFRPLAADPRALTLIDDVAVMTPPTGCELALKTDAIVAGIHFLPDDPADTVARKALRVNLSDLAAKGAVPSGYLLTLALPAGVSDAWLTEFARGLAEDGAAFGCPLLGGDTVRSPGPVMVSIAMIGTAPIGTMVRRTGARAGDRVFVSGTIGDAWLGLAVLQDRSRWGFDAGTQGHVVGRYRVPQPRTALAQAIRTCASASMDVSDGLAGDLAKLCRASGVGAMIEAGRVPLSSAAQAVVGAEPALLATLLSAGDDYEILCTVRADQVATFLASAGEAGVPVSEIGRVTEEAGPPLFRDASGHRVSFTRAAFSHF